tara:strand:+ start:15984 stop:16310 length:327 start_codon:yes stop_codon:yes gene_type:complete
MSQLNVRILGNQPEPSLTQEGLNIVDFEVRTRDQEVFELGKALVLNYIAARFYDLELFSLNDPMTVGIYPNHSDDLQDSPYNFDQLVLDLEAMGFYGKAAGYKEVVVG